MYGYDSICPNCENVSYNMKKMYCYKCHFYSVGGRYLREGYYHKDYDIVLIRDIIQKELKDLKTVYLTLIDTRDWGPIFLEEIWKNNKYLVDFESDLFLTSDWKYNIPAIVLEYTNSEEKIRDVPKNRIHFKKLVQLSCPTCSYNLSLMIRKEKEEEYYYCWECEKEITLDKESKDYKRSLCQSPLEQKFFDKIYSNHPEVEVQFEIGEFHVDFAFPQKKIAVEIEGHSFHSSKEQRIFDAKREREIQSLGWIVYRFTGSEIFSDIDKHVNEIEEILKEK